MSCRRLVPSCRPALLALVLAAGAVSALDLQFWRENISLFVKDTDTVAVTGTYFFRSKSGAALSASVFYPFPVDSTHDFPVRWSVTPAGGGDALLAPRGRDGVTFAVAVPANGACSLTVVYVQHVRQQRARYILTTTAAWEEPLGPSNYSVSLPDSLQLEFMSYPADTVLAAGGRTAYWFFRDQFMPDRDIECAWRTAQ